MMKCIRRLFTFSALLGAACPLLALQNQVCLPLDLPDASIQESWLAKMLPQIEPPKKQTANVQKPQETYVEPFSGEIRFAPPTQTPGASFQQSGEEFSEYRKKFTPEY